MAKRRIKRPATKRPAKRSGSMFLSRDERLIILDALASSRADDETLQKLKRKML